MPSSESPRSPHERPPDERAAETSGAVRYLGRAKSEEPVRVRYLTAPVTAGPTRAERVAWARRELAEDRRLRMAATRTGIVTPDPVPCDLGAAVRGTPLCWSLAQAEAREALGPRRS